MTERAVSAVITDFDNTLFDWFEFWYQSFSAMLDGLVASSGVDRERLLDEIKGVHEKYGTSEYAFLIEELPSLIDLHPGADLTNVYDEAIHAYRKARKKHLHLYPGVIDTLKVLKEHGCIIVGYTESMGFYTNDRIRRLDLDGVLDFIYSPEDHDLPSGQKPEDLRKYASEHYELKRTKHRHTPKGELKPNPKLLLEIVRTVGVAPSNAIYVGDSLMKDVAMAQAAGIVDVYAKYGAAHKKEEYELLRRVTHWTKAAVEKERALDEAEVKPTFVLERSFAELLDLFDFVHHQKDSGDRHG